MTTESFMGFGYCHSKRVRGKRQDVMRCLELCAPGASQNQKQRTGGSAPHDLFSYDQRTAGSVADSAARTMFGWNSVPATRVAIAIRSLWPQNTLTSRARESSGRFTDLPLRIRATVASSAVTAGMCGRSNRG